MDLMLRRFSWIALAFTCFLLQGSCNKTVKISRVPGVVGSLPNVSLSDKLDTEITVNVSGAAVENILLAEGDSIQPDCSDRTIAKTKRISVVGQKAAIGALEPGQVYTIWACYSEGGDQKSFKCPYYQYTRTSGFLR